MNDWEVQEQLMRLRVAIGRQQQELTELEAEVEKIRRQLAPIQQRYDRIVKPIAEKVLVLREAVRELEGLRRRQARGATSTVETLWEEAYQWHRRNPVQGSAYTEPPFDPEAMLPKQRPKATEDIKKVYRRLARRYHPDLARDAQDRLYRNDLMARVNDAYGLRDLEALLALSDSSEAEVEDLGDVPLVVLKLRRLQAESAELAERLQELKLEKFDLIHSPLFDLKLQEKWDKRKGRNPLQEMADWFQVEYTQLNQRLNELRRMVE